MLSSRKFLPVLGLFLIGCTPYQGPEAVVQEVGVAMIALIANSHRYDQLKVTTFGYLKKGNDVRLYVSREDALNQNLTHSIKLSGIDTLSSDKISTCNNYFVTVSGTLNVTENKLSLEDIAALKGGLKNTYSKFVCN